MLVLSRKTDETIVIHNNIRIRILSISGSRVRLGIEAPDQVLVERLELHQRRIEVPPGSTMEGDLSCSN